MRNELHSKQRLKRRKKAAVFKILSFIFIVIGLGAGLYSIPRYSEITIKNIEVSGNQIVSQSEIEDAVRQELQGNKYFFFPKKNIFWYSEDQIKKTLLSLDPHISLAIVSFKNFQTIEVSITERFPQSLWCGVFYQKAETESLIENCYFIDKTGFIYAKAPTFSGNPFVRYYGGIASSTTSVIGAQLIQSMAFKSATLLIVKMKKDNFPVSDFVISADSLVEVYLEKGGKLILTLDQDFEKEFENFKTLVNSKNFKGKDLEGNIHFNYVDLRFGNKLFYKL